MRIARLSMECFLRELSPEESDRLELTRIELRISNLQRTIQQLIASELTHREPPRKSGKPIYRIHRLLDHLETEVDNLARHLRE